MYAILWQRTLKTNLKTNLRTIKMQQNNDKNLDKNSAALNIIESNMATHTINPLVMNYPITNPQFSYKLSLGDVLIDAFFFLTVFFIRPAKRHIISPTNIKVTILSDKATKEEIEAFNMAEGDIGFEAYGAIWKENGLAAPFKSLFFKTTSAYFLSMFKNASYSSGRCAYVKLTDHSVNLKKPKKGNGVFLNASAFTQWDVLNLSEIVAKNNPYGNQKSLTQQIASCEKFVLSTQNKYKEQSTPV